MNKKIIIGSIFAAFLMVSIPFISVAQEQQSGMSQDLTEEPEELLEILVEKLNDLYDYLAGNPYHISNEVDLQEFRNNIDIISEGWDTNPGFCLTLLAIRLTLSLILFFTPPPESFLIAQINLILAALYWAVCINMYTYDEATAPCGCSTTI